MIWLFRSLVLKKVDHPLSCWLTLLRLFVGFNELILQWGHGNMGVYKRQWKVIPSSCFTCFMTYNCTIYWGGVYRRQRCTMICNIDKCYVYSYVCIYLSTFLPISLLLVACHQNIALFLALFAHCHLSSFLCRYSYRSISYRYFGGCFPSKDSKAPPEFLDSSKPTASASARKDGRWAQALEILPSSCQGPWSQKIGQIGIEVSP